MRGFRTWLIAVAVLAAGLLLIGHPWSGPKPEADGTVSAPETAERDAAARDAAASADSFDEWLRSAPDQNIEAGIALAQERARRMHELIRTDPEQALREALTWADWQRLPDEIRPYVEEPFSALADVRVVIACGPDVSKTFISTLLPDGSELDTYVYGRRNGLGSKNSSPVQGIRLDGAGALRPEVFQLLEGADEEAALKLFPVAVEDPGGDSVAALAGGKIFYFISRTALDEANRRLAAIEDLPGPDSGIQSLFMTALAGDMNFEALEAEAAAAAEAWTGTPRDMYVIMADFPDVPGVPTDPAAFSNTLNTTVSQQIREMSYEKTYINATVNPKLYHISNPSSSYSSNAEPIHSEVTALVTADGIDLSPYETVCVLFPHTDQIGFAGLADLGGPRMWLNGSTGDRVVVHELGHNYSASHASTWEVAGTDPVDPAGSRLEYGDFLDIMGSASAPEGHFNAWHKKKVGWFDAQNWLSVADSGIYRIYRSDHYQTAGTVRGLEIDKSGSDQYWIGLRQEFPAYDTFSRGAYLLWKQNGTNRSHLLDTTPQSADGAFDGGLALGQTYSDTTAGVHITPVARGGQTPDEWMDVTVNLGGFPGNAPPTASLSAPAGTDVRSSVLLSVTASDPDGDELAYHWDTGDGQVKPNAPQIAAAWLSGSSAAVSCTVSDMKGGSVTVSQTVTLTDPINSWTSRASGTAQDLNDICLGSGRLVAVGDKANTVYSDDGINWTMHADGNIYMANVFLEGVVFDGTRFIAVGMNYDYSTAPVGWEQVIFTSVDGTYWTERYETDDGSPSNIRFNDVAVGGGVYVAVGDSGRIARSADGISWSPVSSGTAIDLAGISYGDGTFVAVGSAPGGGPATVLTSPDGWSWTDRSSGVDLDSWKGLDYVQYCNDRFLASGWHAKILGSQDQGSTFTTSMGGNNLIIPAFAYGDGVFFAAGLEKVYTDTWYTYDINLISLDGSAWATLPTASQNDRNAAVFYNGTFITVGNGGSIRQSGPVGSISDGYGVWQYANADGLGYDRDPLDDADFDGSPNLIEYALGTSAADAASRPVSGYAALPGGYLQIACERDGIRSDIDYIVERGVNLSSSDWSTANTVIVMDNDTNLTVRSAIPIAGQTNEFMQFRVELR